MKKSPTFRINPNFRLQSNYLHVAWYRVDAHTLQTEIAFAVPARQVFNKNKGCLMMAERDANALTFVYADITDWDNRSLQKWLREVLREYIFEQAVLILPQKLHVLEQKHNLYAKGVCVKKLRAIFLGNVRTTA